MLSKKELKKRDADDQRVITRLRKAGVRVRSVFDLINREGTCPASLPGLLDSLSVVKEAGVLTQEEFDSKEKDLLSRM